MADTPRSTEVIKYADPQTVKQFYVNNLLDAAERITKSYSGTTAQQDELWEILTNQAEASQRNENIAIFPDSTDALFEKGLKAKGPEAVKTVAAALIEKRVPAVSNYPTDQKVAQEFKAIVASSLNSAIDSRASTLAKVSKQTPVAATAAGPSKITTNVAALNN